MAKLITALYGDTLCIDPVGLTDAEIQNTKKKVEEKLGKKLKLMVAPKAQWMPNNAGTELAKAVAKDLGIDFKKVNK